MTTLRLSHKRKLKMWTQKKCQSSVKIKNKTSSKWIIYKWSALNFSLYILYYFNFKWHIVINFILESPFHIFFKNYLHGFFYQPHV